MNPRRIVLDHAFLGGALALAVSGCSSSANTPSAVDAGNAADASLDATGSPDAASSDSAGVDAASVDASDSASSSDAGGCSGLADTASAVAEEYSATAPPAATGGTLADGTYFLTAATIYTGAGGPTGPTGHTRKATLQLSGTAFLYSSDDDGTPYQQRGTVASSGSALSGAVTCPAGSTDPFTSFTVTATGFMELAPNWAGTTATFVHTWTKQ